MPRTPGAKSKATPKIQPMDFQDVKPISLTPNGQALFDKVSSRWKLDYVATELLTIAAQNVSEAEKCHQVLEREGYSYTTRFDEPKPHPLLKQEQQFLAAASNTLSKLHQGLG